MPHILNIAHRGARSLAPENTLTAARKALEAGADMWELDVSMTADGELILMHDLSLERTCDARERFPARRPWLVSQFTLAEIQTLDCGSWFNERDPFGQIQAGAVSEKDRRSYVGQRAPTLRQALEFTRDQYWRASVEIKDISHQLGDEVIVEKVVALIEELDMVDQVLIFSFNPDYLHRVRAANPQLPTAFLTSSGVQNPPAYLRELGAQAYNPEVTVVQEKEVHALRSAGFSVCIWTVNDEQTMRELIALGVSGMITDFPQTLTRVLQESH